MLFLLGIVAVSLIILLLSRLSEWVERWKVERKKEEHYHRRAHYYERYGNTSQPARNAIAARLHSIANQLDTYKEQQKRSEHKRTAREIITLIVIGFTALFAFGSDWIFYNQLDEMREERRAWLGPVTAGIEGDLTISKPLSIVINYQNTGKEPALNVFYDLSPDTISIADDKAGGTVQRVANYVGRCSATSEREGYGVAYPSAGFSTYSVATKVDAAKIDWDVIYGTKYVLVNGCFVYHTLGTTRRSSYCFFFQNGKTRKAAWNFCPTGNFAN
jgi:hypothetical protein